ncbi:hypothetical protein ACH42_10800 [Endozoicomonas sp. (ex Bugula neritina AB1)]|nr:hypothetical protein ACH42_10800 [Endozoicomonas sp. (ex Bugula neritina AB1)]
MCLLLCLQASLGCSDTVWLENGDVLTGSIIKLDEGKLSLKTTYAGTVVVDWGAVRALDSDQELWVSLVGESEPQKRTLKKQVTGVAVIEGDGVKREFSAVWPLSAIHQELPKLADTWRVRGDLGAGLDSQFGNDQERSLSLDGELKIDDQWNKNTLRWNYEKEHDDGLETSEWLMTYAYSRYLDEHVYIQGAGTRDFDSDADLRYRTSAGGSLGYRFWETRKRELRTSAGLSRFWEKYKINNRKKDFAITWMINYRSELKEALEYYSDTQIFYRLGSGERLVTLNQGIKWRFDSGISLKLDHSLDYDSQSLDVIKKTDNQIKMKVGYQW